MCFLPTSNSKKSTTIPTTIMFRLPFFIFITVSKFLAKVENKSLIKKKNNFRYLILCRKVVVFFICSVLLTPLFKTELLKKPPKSKSLVKPPTWRVSFQTRQVPSQTRQVSSQTRQVSSQTRQISSRTWQISSRTWQVSFRTRQVSSRTLQVSVVYTC